MSQPEIKPLDQLNQTWIANGQPPDWQNPRPTGRYNLLVIGGGSGGLVTAVGAHGLGAKVALVEKNILGGDCLNAGCVPSKTIIRSAKVLGELRRAEQLGIHLPAGAAADFPAVMKRMRAIRAEISHHDSAERFKNLGIDTFFGAGQFTSANTFSVGGQTIHFKKAVIATGSRPTVIPFKGLQEAGFLTNQDVFYHLTELPPRLAVIGAGPIGCELAQTFQRFGSQVTMFDVAPQILPREEKEAAELIRNRLQAESISLNLAANVQEIRVVDGSKIILFTQNDERKETAVDEILLAVGRRANTEDLGLEKAGVATHKQGITVNDRLQTTNRDIYAVGDVASKYQFTHTADEMARIVIQNALFLGRRKFSDVIVPWVTFTDPEVAHVGLYPDEARAAGIATTTFTTQIADIDRGRADGEDGFVKIYVKKGSDKIVGATIVARHAGEIIGEICVAMRAGVGMKTLAQTVHPYPTTVEAVRKTADAWNRTRLTPTVTKIFNKWLAWSR